jgi:ADP-heptose:LPS heptosyltransferase
MAAFVTPDAWGPPGLALPYPDVGHESERLLALVAAMGAPPAGAELEFPLANSDDRELAERVPELPEGPLAVVHPGARDRRRRWPVASFAAVADSLAARGFHVLLTGTESERGVLAAVRQQMTHPALDLAGRTSLGALAALLARAKLLIANDTGVSHLAAAVGTPSVVLFSASDPARWAPLGPHPHTIIDARRGGAGAAAVTEAALELAGAELLHA